MILEGKKIAFLGASIERGAYLNDENTCYSAIIRDSIDWATFSNHSVPGSRIGEYIGPDPKRIKHKPLPSQFSPSPYAYNKPCGGHYHRTSRSHNHTINILYHNPKWSNQLRRLLSPSTAFRRAEKAHSPRVLHNASAISLSTPVRCIVP